MMSRACSNVADPEDPVETELESVGRIEADGIEGVFRTHGTGVEEISNQMCTEKIASRVRDGEIVSYRSVYKTYVPRKWIEHHQSWGSNAESFDHHELKVIAAEYLDRCGHDIPTFDRLGPTADGFNDRDWEYAPYLFETRYGAGIADLVCDCSDCETVVEVGNTPARKLWAEVNRDRYSVDSFVVLPYSGFERIGNRGSRVEIFSFFARERLADAFRR